MPAVEECPGHLTIDQGKLFRSRHALRLPMMSIIRGAILACAFVVFAVPIPYLFLVSLGPAILNAAELVYMLIILLSFAAIIFSQRVRPYMFLLLSLGLIVLFKITFSLLLGGGLNMTAATRQLRIFMPLFGSLALLSSTIKLPYDRLKNVLAWAAIVNSLVALYIYFFDLPVLETSEVLEAVVDASSGRLVNGNVHLALFMVFFVATASRRGRSEWLLYFALAVSLVSMFFSLNRTSIVGTAALLAIYLLTGVIRLTHKLESRVSLVLLLAVIVVVQLVSQNERMVELVQRRFSISGSTDYSVTDPYSVSSSLQNRLPLYDEYVHTALSHPLLGPGIGQAITRTQDSRGRWQDVVTTDISFLTIFFVFGLPGVVVFGLFLCTLFKATHRRLRTLLDCPRYGKAYTALFLVILLMTLNDDLLTRKNPVFFLSLLSIAVQDVPPGLNRSDDVE